VTLKTDSGYQLNTESSNSNNSVKSLENWFLEPAWPLWVDFLH